LDSTVRDQPDRLVGQIDRQSMTARFDQRPRGFDGGIHHGRELDVLAPQRQLPARDTRHVEQIVEQARHVLHLALDDLAAPFYLRFGSIRRARDLRRLADRRERIAHLVRQGREKLVLAPVGIFQDFRRFDHLGDVGTAAHQTEKLPVG
jgi:hypothetical protein